VISESLLSLSSVIEYSIIEQGTKKSGKDAMMGKVSGVE
jgi:hypothetical protein